MIKDILNTTDRYNLHAHTQFCDGRDPMTRIAEASAEAGLKVLGFTPHSPVPVESPCNMGESAVGSYLEEVGRLREAYDSEMDVLSSFEIDFLSAEWGPHIDYFQKLPLDYRLGSVHFVPTRDGRFVDCDGRYERFAQHLAEDFSGDLRYVVEKYFEQVLTMLERGGLDLLGHFDKIAGNASEAQPGIEEERWYESLVEDVVSHVAGSEVVVEVNTKTFADKGRFFPNERWWPKLKEAGIAIAVDSDAHYASKVVSGREEALSRLRKLG